MYASDPEAWTIRQLAVKFGFSLKRVEAILKLKSSEKQLEAQVSKGGQIAKVKRQGRKEAHIYL